jgi:hypothetical protein
MRTDTRTSDVTGSSAYRIGVDGSTSCGSRVALKGIFGTVLATCGNRTHLVPTSSISLSLEADAEVALSPVARGSTQWSAKESISTPEVEHLNIIVIVIIVIVIVIVIIIHIAIFVASPFLASILTSLTM